MSSDGLPTSFFLSDGEAYRGTVLARGPWDDGSAHGGPVAALIGREVGRFDPDPELFTVRLTIELLRPVPLDLLHLETTMLRPGKRVRLIGVSVVHDGTEVARAVALRIRRPPEDAPVSRPTGALEIAGPEDSAPAPSLVDAVGITSAVELRATSGSAIEQGPATYWFRILRPLVDDEAVTPLTRALIAADFGNGISSAVSYESHVFINPDLTVHLHRLPVGEWVINDAETWLEAGTAARADAVLADVEGPFGRASQNLFIADAVTAAETHRW